MDSSAESTVEMAALELFTTRGYGDTTMRDVALYLDIPLEALQEDYPSKQDLLVSVAGPLLIMFDVLLDRSDLGWEELEEVREELRAYWQMLLLHQRDYQLAGELVVEGTVRRLAHTAL